MNTAPYTPRANTVTLLSTTLSEAASLSYLHTYRELTATQPWRHTLHTLLHRNENTWCTAQDQLLLYMDSTGILTMTNVKSLIHQNTFNLGWIFKNAGYLFSTSRAASLPTVRYKSCENHINQVRALPLISACVINLSHHIIQWYVQWRARHSPEYPRSSLSQAGSATNPGCTVQHHILRGPPLMSF